MKPSSGNGPRTSVNLGSRRDSVWTSQGKFLLRNVCDQMSIDMFGDSHLKLTSEYQDSNESQAAEELFRSMVMGFWAQMQPSMDANFSNKFQMCTTLERYTCGTFRQMQTSTNKKWLLFVHWAPGTLPHYSTSLTWSVHTRNPFQRYHCLHFADWRNKTPNEWEIFPRVE